MTWSLDPTNMYNFENKFEVLIQIAGNWRLVKWRKTSEEYDCFQCKARLIIQKHPAFCEINLQPAEGIIFESGMVHHPYDSEHQKIKGVTHSNIRYFAKKHWKLTDDPLVILGLLRHCYPLLQKHFNPDLRKIFDIAYRERKQQLYELDPNNNQNPGMI